MIFLGFLLALLLLVASITLGGLDKLWLFYDTQSVVITLLGIAGYVLLFGRKEFLRGIKSYFAFSFSADEESIKAGQFFQRLSLFTVFWGLLCVIFSLVWSMAAADLEAVGQPMAFGLLSFFYAIVLTVFIFLPIGFRLSPPGSGVACQRLAIRLSLIGIAMFFLVRFWIVLLMLLLQTTGRQDSIHFQEFGHVIQATLFAINPADPLGDYSFFSGIHMIALYIDLPSLIFVLGGWWAFRLASGKRRRWIAAPILIFIGLLGTIVGNILMLTNFDFKMVGIGFMIAMLTTLYAFIGAAGFLIADMRSSFRTPPPNPPTESTEQAKAIIDRVIESEQHG